MKTFEVSVIGGTIIVREPDGAIIAAGSPKRCADTLEEIFETMLDEVTEADFRAYERVRRSGRYNMLMDQRSASIYAGLSLERYQAVLTHYEELRLKCPA